MAKKYRDVGEKVFTQTVVHLMYEWKISEKKIYDFMSWSFSKERIFCMKTIRTNLCETNDMTKGALVLFDAGL